MPLYPAAGGRLEPNAGAEPASASHKVDFSAGTGRGTRYERIAGISSSQPASSAGAP